jgi:hypothetical protein
MRVHMAAIVLAPDLAVGSNRSPRKRNRSLDASMPKFRILKNRRPETRRRMSVLWR